MEFGAFKSSNPLRKIGYCRRPVLDLRDGLGRLHRGDASQLRYRKVSILALFYSHLNQTFLEPQVLAYLRLLLFITRKPDCHDIKGFSMNLTINGELIQIIRVLAKIGISHIYTLLTALLIWSLRYIMISNDMKKIQN